MLADPTADSGLLLFYGLVGWPRCLHGTLGVLPWGLNYSLLHLHTRVLIEEASRSRSVYKCNDRRLVTFLRQPLLLVCDKRLALLVPWHHSDAACNHRRNPLAARVARFPVRQGQIR